MPSPTVGSAAVALFTASAVCAFNRFKWLYGLTRHRLTTSTDRKTMINSMTDANYKSATDSNSGSGSGSGRGTV